VGPRVHVVRDVVDEDASEPGGPEYDHVIQALPSDRADEALDVAFCHGERGAVTTSRICIAPIVDATQPIACDGGSRRPQGRVPRLGGGCLPLICALLYPLTIYPPWI
jgi:hypothetical protein